MRQQVTIALLAVCATLLAVQVVTSLSRTPVLPAFGQSVTGNQDYILATGMSTTGNNNMLYVFQMSTQKLAAYSVKTQGIEYQGTRLIKFDLIPEEAKGGVQYTVAKMKDLTKKDGKDDKKE